MTIPPTAQASVAKPRCAWCEGDAAMQHYHDHEWGFTVTDDFVLFEKIALESFQAGLSWRTILHKRASFRHAFAGFDFHQIASFNAADVQRLMADTGIVRHRGKILACLHNAQRAQEAVAEFGSLWAFLRPYAPITAGLDATVPSSTAESITLAGVLKKRGWKFLGPTTVYALMQSSGLVNDHAADCHVRAQVQALRRQRMAAPI